MTYETDMNELRTIPSRVCGDCSKCCEGSFEGSAYGKPFWRGLPCHFLEGGKCSIYGNHPKDPCQTFRCAWLDDLEIPGWLKPNEVNAVMIHRKEANGTEYMEIQETGETLRSDVLSWAVMHCLRNKLNLRYSINGGINWIRISDWLKLEGAAYQERQEAIARESTRLEALTREDQAKIVEAWQKP